MKLAFMFSWQSFGSMCWKQLARSLLSIVLKLCPTSKLKSISVEDFFLWFCQPKKITLFFSSVNVLDEAPGSSRSSWDIARRMAEG